MGVLDGKAVVVTGAGRGIGAAYARAAAAEGALVVVNDVDTDLCEHVAASLRAIGGRALAHVADVRYFDAAQGLIARCVDAFGACDGLVNNAGVLHVGRPEDLTEQALHRVLGVNVVGTVYCGVAAMRQMIRQGEGSIVNVTSGSAPGLPLLSVYGASKAAVSSLTRSWAADLGGTGVRVNAVSPRALTLLIQGAAQYLGVLGANVTGEIPPEANAPAVVWLLSGRSAGVTGQVVRVHDLDITLVGPSHPVLPTVRMAASTVDEVAAAFGGPLAAALQPVRSRSENLLRHDDD